MVLFLLSACRADCALVDWNFFDYLSGNFPGRPSWKLVFKCPDSLLFFAQLISQSSHLIFKSTDFCSVDLGSPISTASTVDVASTSISALILNSALFSSSQLSLQAIVFSLKLVNDLISLSQLVIQNLNGMIGFIELIAQIVKFIVKPFVFLLQIANSSLDWSAFSSLAFELSSDLIELFFLQIAVSAHLFDDSFQLLAFSLKLFGLVFIFLWLSLLGLSLLSKPLILFFDLS